MCVCCACSGSKKNKKVKEKIIFLKESVDKFGNRLHNKNIR